MLMLILVLLIVSMIMTLLLMLIVLCYGPEALFSYDFHCALLHI